ncbi:glycosyltransferase family 2 protein [Vibrio astriarenae]
MNYPHLNGLVSVVTPAFNSKNVILKCVESVVNQTLSVKEHIIVDDGSVDGTSEYLKQLCLQYPHIKVLTQSNQGAGVARNYAISEAKAKYIAFLDADDCWLPNKLESQIGFMESNEIDFSYGDYEREYIDSPSKKSVFVAPESIRYRDLLFSCPIGCLTAAYNQESVGKHYMSEVRQGQDWSLWLKITKSGVVAKKYPGVHAIYNIYEDSLSSNAKKKLINMYKIYREQPFGHVYSLFLLFFHAFGAMFRNKR